VIGRGELDVARIGRSVRGPVAAVPAYVETNMTPAHNHRRAGQPVREGDCTRQPANAQAEPARAAWLVQAGVSIRELAELLRHSDIRVTMSYTHLAPQNVRAAVGALESEVSRSRFTLPLKEVRKTHLLLGKIGGRYWD
jgi:hypothetical protein